jgi:outer membrane receptor protein involved in Fe transport
VQSSASVYTADNFGIQLRHMFGTAHPWTVTAGGNYGLNDYESRTTIADTSYDRDYLSANAGIAYQPRLWLTLGLYYRYSQSNGSSASSGVDYSVNEVSFAASLGY